MLNRRPIVVTNCTTRKAGGARISLEGVSLRGEASEIAKRWRALVTRAPKLRTAADLYKGRAMADATASANFIAARLHIVSAGLGLISGDDQVPNYDLTVSVGSPLIDALANAGQGPCDWWAALTQSRPHPLADLAQQSFTCIALPASYLSMIQDDLSHVPRAGVKKIRIFTSEAGLKFVPPQATECVMPYDERLETTKGFAGTRADFPQRAMRHFVEQLGAHRLSLDDAKRTVETYIRGRRRRTMPTRARVSDQEILKLLRRHWGTSGGHSTRLLRYLRDEALVSCEQGRFRNLWKTLAAELEGT